MQDGWPVRRSIRYRDYDYAEVGAYFVTICTQGRYQLFGEVIGGEMVLNEVGLMVDKTWKALPDRFRVEIDESIVMPDHLHGIIWIMDVYCGGEHRRTGEHEVRPYGTAHGSLGRIVQAFKSLSTREYIVGVREKGWPLFPGRIWQRNYYDRIIRDDRELAALRKYIKENPMNWKNDPT